ncbi:MAG: VWA domain-containing protein [Acholeplasmatales bacterium]|nr:MAG: VWA domain-containing protein [Acholeplasmatales bacterium]
MKRNLVEMVFILDRSGSMQGLEKQTIDGFNEFISKQKSVAGEAVVSTVLFNHTFDVLHHRLDIREVRPLEVSDYRVNGTTALLDAIGRGIEKIAEIHHFLPEASRPEQTIFIITTDGMENASRSYRYQDIKRRIAHQKEHYGWEFIFLGANMDAIETARQFGIHASRAATYRSDAEGTRLNYRVIGETVSELRKNKHINENWKDKIEEDVKYRK